MLDVRLPLNQPEVRYLFVAFITHQMSLKTYGMQAGTIDTNVYI